MAGKPGLRACVCARVRACTRACVCALGEGDLSGLGLWREGRSVMGYEPRTLRSLVFPTVGTVAPSLKVKQRGQWWAALEVWEAPWGPHGTSSHQW